jgi:RNA polymerase sigma factor (sigma-70 family)
MTSPDHLDARTERRERLSAICRDAVDGDRHAFEQLVTELTPLLWRVARSTGLDAAACEDVVQQTWLKLLGHLQRIRTAEAVSAWLVTVTRREAVRAYTAYSRTRPAEEATLERVPDGDPLAEELIVQDERRRVLWRVVRQLPERCIQLLQVIAFSDRPDYAATSAALGMPIGSIGPTRGRCLAKLRELLAAQPDWSWR